MQIEKLLEFESDQVRLAWELFVSDKEKEYSFKIASAEIENLMHRGYMLDDVQVIISQTDSTNVFMFVTSPHGKEEIHKCVFSVGTSFFRTKSENERIMNYITGIFLRPQTDFDDNTQSADGGVYVGSIDNKPTMDPDLLNNILNGEPQQQILIRGVVATDGGMASLDEVVSVYNKWVKKTTSTIKIGDVVQMNSGSPEMTVIELYETDNSINCAWFDTTEVPNSNIVRLPIESVMVIVKKPS